MNFDLSWFKTVPGLLITCGVVLLIIALIIFIVTSKNNKNAKKEAQDNNPKERILLLKIMFSRFLMVFLVKQL